MASPSSVASTSDHSEPSSSLASPLSVKTLISISIAGRRFGGVVLACTSIVARFARDIASIRLFLVG
ncbi:hypothetical protein HBH70_222120 [Parastagonospora nodorum]|nr:hypothetical protein HBH53_225780 [Parastagonospora nodorum]KAH4045128.1 hypothetical protein HBH49_205270 [Parastagonospora nodorum]KAH4153361.1 hypothetical protein HBH43_225010 [Parastagonospora nodorum]KAH4181663.1 hypothetical protein HBH42_232630 [Parastagonospora nodorum]KAH4285244.1 hypothetical protein HBI02_232830 [Parastagonospora nodorum]